MSVNKTNSEKCCICSKEVKKVAGTPKPKSCSVGTPIDFSGKISIAKLVAPRGVGMPQDCIVLRWFEVAAGVDKETEVEVKAKAKPRYIIDCSLLLSLLNQVKKTVPVVSETVLQPPMSASSFALFIELEGHNDFTTPSSIASRSLLFQMSRTLDDDEIEEELLFDGSDDEEYDEDDETRGPVIFMRLQAEEQMLEDAEPSSLPPPSLSSYIVVDIRAGPSTRSASQADQVSMVSVSYQTDFAIRPTTAFDMEWTLFPSHSDLNLPGSV
ncbi:hypothetical protein EVAR_26913_1 [Eumeta japonica]|uniref:Uncharacterized protein n=1 Tax=Eumeta variegata TaxID=151549 RepID=A0A4C1VSX6_EUMVA|nr:hypothetical protein EVAR_26913_1 [Eumeta japonica]